MNSVVIEIRSDRPNLEVAQLSSLFAKDLLGMYLRYAELNNWETNIVEKIAPQTAIYTGIITITSENEDALTNFKFESGRHRIQSIGVHLTQRFRQTSGAFVQIRGEEENTNLVRTYSYHDNRVTDHRIGLSLHCLDLIMMGDLECIVKCLQHHHLAQPIR